MSVSQQYLIWNAELSATTVAVTTSPQQISGGSPTVNLAALGKPANRFKQGNVLYNPVGGNTVYLSTDAAGLFIICRVDPGNNSTPIPAAASFPLYIFTATSTASVNVFEVQ